MAAATGNVVPVVAMIIVQTSYAAMNIVSKLAIQSGMSPLVLVAYRQIFGAAALAPFAYCFERKSVPKMTMPIMFQIFLSSLTGITGNQVFYFVGLKYTTTTVACALTNLLPAFTFVLAVLFRQEHVRIKTWSAQAKVLGTVLGVGGAALLSFYQGKTIDIGESRIEWSYAERMDKTDSSHQTNSLIGPLILIASPLSWSVWFIIQTKMSKKFPAPCTSSTYMCMMGSIQCTVIALFFEHKASGWSLRNTTRLVSALFSGIINTGLAYFLMSWTIQRKGPLYVTVFSPLQVVIVAVFGWALLRQKLHVGTAVGSILIIVGLYAVLWGKKKEGNVEEDVAKETELVKHKEKNASNDLELSSNGGI